MSSSKLKACLSHWQVVLMLILIAGAVIAIAPRFEDGKFTTNLQYGLDLQEAVAGGAGSPELADAPLPVSGQE